MLPSVFSQPKSQLLLDEQGSKTKEPWLPHFTVIKKRHQVTPCENDLGDRVEFDWGNCAFLWKISSFAPAVYDTNCRPQSPLFLLESLWRREWLYGKYMWALRVSSSLARGDGFTSLGSYSFNAKVTTFKCVRVYYEWNYTQQWCAMQHQGTTLINLRFKSWMNILKRDQLEWKLRAAFSYGTDFYALIGSNCKWTFLSIHLWIIVIILSIFITYLKLNLDDPWNCDPVSFVFSQEYFGRRHLVSCLLNLNSVVCFSRIENVVSNWCTSNVACYPRELV